MSSWGNWYWPTLLIGWLVVFLPAELFALFTNAHNTLSAWVWRVLRVVPNQDWLKWNAEDYLIFGCWLVMLTWLTAHFFFGRFR